MATGECWNLECVSAVADRYRSYQKASISAEISPFDDMFVANQLERYLSVGRSAITIIADALVLSRKTRCASILDLPCGGGRVTRHLVAFFPEAEILVGDLDKDKQAFVVNTFPVQPFEAAPDFNDTPRRKFDLIFVGSLLTHLDETYWKQALDWFVSALEEDGLLVVTTHGRETASTKVDPNSPMLRPMCESYLKTGFDFRLSPGQENETAPPYGTTLTAPSWVMKVVERIPQIRILNFRESAWGQHQDVLCLQNRPVGDIHNLMGAAGCADVSRGEVEPSSAPTELVVLRKALEDARFEARMATISARASEKALARQRGRAQQALARERAQIVDARRLAKKWQRDCKSEKKKYDRITATTAWKVFVRLNQALTIMRRGRLALYAGPTACLGMTLHRSSPRVVEERLQDVRPPDLPDPENAEDKPSAEKLKVKAASVKVRAPKPSTNSKTRSKAPPGGELSPLAASPSKHRVPDLGSLRAMSPRGRIAVVLHLYYPELWPDFRDAVGTIPEPADLFVTLTAGHSEDAADWIRADFPTAQIITLDNLGRDIFPFVTLVNSGVLFRYRLVCKLHTKRSLHKADGDAWRRDLLSGVLSDPDHVTRILAAFDADSGLGIVVDDGSVRDEGKNWRRHVHRVNDLCARIGLPVVTAESGWPEFPAGSIYWARSSVLGPVARLMLTAADFEPEPLPDGCTPHAIERLVGHLCREAGMYVAKSSVFSKPSVTQNVTSS